MDWINTVGAIIALLTGLVSLVATGISTYFAIKNWIKATKTKSSSEIWALIQSVADSAMKEAEASAQSGAEKKAMVINIVKASCKSAGLDIDAFLDQLSHYIDTTITFVNDINAKKIVEGK